MNYTINLSALYDLIDEEVSRVAAYEHSDNGDSLYDGIVLHSNDADEIRRLQNDAINTIVKRNYDVVTISPSDSQGNPVLVFSVPDMDTSLESTVKAELDRFIVLNVCAAWFQSRIIAKVEEFANRGQVALDKASTMLHLRKTPTRS